MKRASISGAIREAAQVAPPAASPVVDPAATPVEPRRYHARTREGKKIIAAPVDPLAHQQLRFLAVEQNRKAEDLIREALRDLFVKYGKPPIA